MRVYVSGPMTGKPGKNEPLFRFAEQIITGLGHTPLLPHDIEAPEHEGECPPGYPAAQSGHTSACFLRADLEYMLGYADAVLMLPEWERSIGARLEHDVASRCGMPIVYYFDIQTDHGAAVALHPLGIL